jgi:transcriptional regulator with XRE-family HTH domain
VGDALATVAANVRRLRHERALTQDALAERASMDASEVRRIEAARREPGVRVITRLANGLGVHPGELFEGVSSHPLP